MQQHYDGVLGAAAHMWSAGAAPQGRPPTWMAKPAPVLAYVTPQNGVGYDMAKNHRCRLHYVSPDWFHLQITRGMPELRGSQEVDAEWVAAVREPCSAGAGASGRSSSQVGAETNGTDGGSQVGGRGGVWAHPVRTAGLFLPMLASPARLFTAGACLPDCLLAGKSALPPNIFLPCRSTLRMCCHASPLM